MRQGVRFRPSGNRSIARSARGLRRRLQRADHALAGCEARAACTAAASRRHSRCRPATRAQAAAGSPQSARSLPLAAPGTLPSPTIRLFFCANSAGAMPLDSAALPAKRFAVSVACCVYAANETNVPRPIVCHERVVDQRDGVGGPDVALSAVGDRGGVSAFGPLCSRLPRMYTMPPSGKSSR